MMKKLILVYGYISILLMPAAVFAACSVTSNPLTLAFGNYDSLSGNPVNSIATITIRCTPPASGTVGISAGQSGTVTQRYMASTTTTDKLNYNLYKDVNHTQLWGNTGAQLVSFPSAVNTSLIIYGNIPASQYVSVASYTDNNLTITVTY